MMPARIQWVMAGFSDLRKRPEVVSLVDSECARIADAAGRGFEWKSSMGDDRYRGIVFTDTPRAKAVNQRDNTLLKVLGGGGG